MSVSRTRESLHPDHRSDKGRALALSDPPAADEKREDAIAIPRPIVGACDEHRTACYLFRMSQVRLFYVALASAVAVVAFLGGNLGIGLAATLAVVLLLGTIVLNPKRSKGMEYRRFGWIAIGTGIVLIAAVATGIPPESASDPALYVWGGVMIIAGAMILDDIKVKDH